jgi:hypothetical protein
MASSNSWRGALCAVAFSVGSASSPAIAIAQGNNQIPGIFGLFNGIISNAIVQEARQKWESVPLADYNCLSNRGVSVDDLIAHGIGPKDPRVRQILAQCGTPPPDVRPAGAAAAAQAQYIVDGIALGAIVDIDSDSRFSCHDSDDFVGFRWCQSHRTETGRFGPHTIWSSILHSDKNQAVYVTEAIVPATFSQGDSDAELQRLSQMFAQPANVIPPPPQLGARHAVLATWGQVTLSELDQATMQALRNGDPIHRGVLADFLGDPRKSARAGLPVYSIGGGPGYVWNADYDDSGRGALRLTTCDASQFSPGAGGVAVAGGPAAASPDPADQAAQKAAADDAKAEKAAAQAAAAKQLAEDAAKAQAEATQLQVAAAFANFRNSKATAGDTVIALLNYSTFGADGGAEASFWAKKDDPAKGAYVLYEKGTTLQAPAISTKEFDVSKIDPARFFVKPSAAGVTITANDAVIFVCKTCDKASVENRWVKYFSQDAGK